jgi:hypothetical protein
MVKKRMKLLIKMIDLLNHFSVKKFFLLDQLQWNQLVPRNGVRLNIQLIIKV